MYGATKNEVSNGTDNKQPQDIDVSFRSEFTIFGVSDNGTEILIMYYPDSDQKSEEEDDDEYIIDLEEELSLEDIIEDTTREQREYNEAEGNDEEVFGNFTDQAKRLNSDPKASANIAICLVDFEGTV